jgi:hypothetical protein
VLAQVELRLPEAGVLVVAVLNLSLGGALFELPEPGLVKPGDRVTVHLAAERHQAVQAARVVRVIEGARPAFAVAWQGTRPDTLAVLAILMG